MLNKHSQYMQLAIKEAWKYQLLTYPNPAVGATVVKNNHVLSVESHHEAGLPHAEVLALKSAFLKKYPNSKLKDLDKSSEIHDYLIQNHNGYFSDCEIYVTLEPCNHIGKTPACSQLLESIKIKKVYIGTMDPNKQASGGKQRLEKAGISVETGIEKNDTDQLLDPFLKYQSGSFIFYKMAMREDGSIDGGYITTQDSLNFVHSLRTKIDLMVIGGNTIRTDKPTLDARFANENNPSDILIFSTKKTFDSKIPLFQVKNREVTISSSLELLKNHKYIMVEGGYNLLNVMEDKIDYLVLFISHEVSKNKKYIIDKNKYEFIYSYFINEIDEVIYLKKGNGK